MEICFPVQTHSHHIQEVKTGAEVFPDCDGVWTKNLDLKLGIKTADCAAITFLSPSKKGIIHAGWRGLCDGIVEKMLEIFKDEPHTQIYVAPLLPEFEIQKDDCYDRIVKKFGTQFFKTQNKTIIFCFKDAIKSILPSHTQFDPRNTLTDPNLHSWRQNKTTQRNETII